MQVVKQIFDIFINRTIAYDYAHHIGLITFATTAREVQGIGAVINRLRDAVANITPCGNTALWDALVLAEIKLSTYGEKYPKAKKRIVVLSDGENNQMNHTALEACQRLQVFR
jgi:Mg-chelatase subunit ChlD